MGGDSKRMVQQRRKNCLKVYYTDIDVTSKHQRDYAALSHTTSDHTERKREHTQLTRSGISQLDSK